MVSFGNDWDEILDGEFEKDYYLKLREFLKKEYAAGPVYPPMTEIFSALKATAYKDVKVVIIGQDPYHNPGQAHGMCFSVRKGVKAPPSLNNIFKELATDMNCKIPDNGCLTQWAEQGVLLLNAVLTVRENQANSHKGKGWEIFTDTVISHINEREKPVVFMLWGNNAKAKLPLITNPAHLILTAAHPSPLSAHNGFFGCGHFSQANDFLLAHGMRPIRWQISDISEQSPTEPGRA